MPNKIGVSYLHDGYARSNTLNGWYRDLTIGEAKSLSYTGTVYFVDRYGGVRECKINGKPKTWKTWTGCELPLKYGYRPECFRVGDKDKHSHEALSSSYQDRVVVSVGKVFPSTASPDVVEHWVYWQEVRWAADRTPDHWHPDPRWTSKIIQCAQAIAFGNDAAIPALHDEFLEHDLPKLAEYSLRNKKAEYGITGLILGDGGKIRTVVTSEYEAFLDAADEADAFLAKRKPANDSKLQGVIVYP